ncbi:hypothetical protein BRD17_07310 [Halobacteriales archaeon SW_7_68_16]|nr:MAG: hypothetical protein BRD17_07310 [Halobacteriales archaeon SW_7_68_16]
MGNRYTGEAARTDEYVQRSPGDTRIDEYLRGASQTGPGEPDWVDGVADTLREAGFGGEADRLVVEYAGHEGLAEETSIDPGPKARALDAIGGTLQRGLQAVLPKEDPSVEPIRDDADPWLTADGTEWSSLSPGDRGDRVSERLATTAEVTGGDRADAAIAEIAAVAARARDPAVVETMIDPITEVEVPETQNGSRLGGIRRVDGRIEFELSPRADRTTAAHELAHCLHNAVGSNYGGPGHHPVPRAPVRVPAADWDRISYTPSGMAKNPPDSAMTAGRRQFDFGPDTQFYEPEAYMLQRDGEAVGAAAWRAAMDAHLTTDYGGYGVDIDAEEYDGDDAMATADTAARLRQSDDPAAEFDGMTGADTIEERVENLLSATNRMWYRMARASEGIDAEDRNFSLDDTPDPVFDDYAVSNGPEAMGMAFGRMQVADRFKDADDPMYDDYTDEELERWVEGQRTREIRETGDLIDHHPDFVVAYCELFEPSEAVKEEYADELCDPPRRTAGRLRPGRTVRGRLRRSRDDGRVDLRP